MATVLCPFDWHIIWANKCILESSTERDSQWASCIEMGPPHLDGQYIDPIALESANDCHIW